MAEEAGEGDMIVVRYADEQCWGFSIEKKRSDFWQELRERLRKFGLELHPEKTRLIEFGRYAAERRAKRGEGKPETFNFLGFTHICGKNQDRGHFMVYRKTMGKRMAAKLKDIRQKLRRSCMSQPKTRGSGSRQWFVDIFNTMRCRATSQD